MNEIKLNISSTEKSYSIFIENEHVSDLFKKVLEKNKDYLVVISKKVYEIYKKDLPFDKNKIFVLKDGESEKNFKNLNKIIEKALSLNIKRSGTFIAIGGGVAGDITGLASSIYMRGINLIQIPTTLLACVDSSVGGKTAVNTKFGKNLIGTFYQPNAVYINPKFIQTLDDKQYKSGFGEVIKYAFIEKSCHCEENFNLINILTENISLINSRDEKLLAKIIEICVKLKKFVVEKDEKESSLRRILNFGHTYGHALEKLGNFKRFTHGEAVVEGIRFAFNLALSKELIDKNYKYLAEDLINKFNYKKLPTFDMNKIIPIMKNDKKANKNITFVLPVKYFEVDCFEINDL